MLGAVTRNQLFDYAADDINRPFKLQWLNRYPASQRDLRRRDYVCLDHGSAGVTVKRQKTGELTESGGVRSGDGEHENEKLGDEHGDAGGVSTGWLMSSKEIRPRFYNCYLISCEHKQPGVGPAPCPVQPPIHRQGFQNGNVDFLFRSGFSIIRHRSSPSPGASNRGASSPRPSRSFPVHSLYSFFPLLHSPPSRLAGNPTSSHQFHHPSALVAVCLDIGVP